MLQKGYYRLYTWYYQRLPEKIRNRISRRGRNLYQRVRELHHLLCHVKHNLYVIEGEERGSGAFIRMVYVGEDLTRSYLVKMWFSDNVRCESKGTAYTWQVVRDSFKNGLPGDIVFVMTSKLLAGSLRRKGYFILPEWIGESRDLGSPTDDLWRGLSPNSREFVRKTRARITRFGYSYEIRHEDNAFDSFYRDLYVASAVGRHGLVAEVQSYDYLKAMFKRGGLLFVRRGEVRLGGMLFVVDCGKVFHLVSWGVLEGKEEHLTEGVGHALYYFAIVWAKQQGCVEFNFGGSRPFLSDGILNYKKRWGARVKENPWLTEILGLRIENPRCAGVRSFLARNGLITIDEKGPAAYVFADRVEGLSTEEIDETKKLVSLPGIDRVFVVSLPGAGDVGWERAVEGEREVGKMEVNSLHEK